jgi:hypothetical protein
MKADTKGKKGNSSKSSKKNKEVESKYEGLSVELGKSDKGKIVLSIQEYGDKTYLDIRHFFKDKDGNWAPTKKGCSVPAELSVKLRKKLAKLIKLADDADVEVGVEE